MHNLSPQISLALAFRLLLPALLVLPLVLVPVAESAAPYELRSWDELSDQEMSALGRAALRGRPARWIHAESDRYIYHATNRRTLDRVAREVEWADAEIARRLELEPIDTRGRWFVVDDERVWRRLMRMSGGRHDGAAIHLGGELFIRRDRAHGLSQVDIPHELVHFRLQQAVDDIPLWLEEGLAQWLGWELGKRHQLRQGVTLHRERELIPEEYRLAWDDLLLRTSYPRDPDQNRSFYRQSTVLIEQLAQALGPDEMGTFLRRVLEHHGDLHITLEIAYGWSPDDEAEFFERVESILWP